MSLGQVRGNSRVTPVKNDAAAVKGRRELELALGVPEDHHQDRQTRQGTGDVVTFPRTFPIRLAPLPCEALDSWLEALACRLNVRLGDVFGDVGLAALSKNVIREYAVPTDWTIAL